MEQPKRLCTLGHYRFHIRCETDSVKQYVVQFEYIWNRQVYIRT